MMNDFIIKKEIESVKNDRKISLQQIEVAKNKMAQSLRQQMDGANFNTISTPIKRKIPLKKRFSNFIKKIKIIFGFYGTK